MPSVTLQPDATDGVDTMIRDYAPTATGGTETELWLGRNASNNRTGRVLIKFTGLSLPAGATITSASLLLHINEFTNDLSRTAEFYRVRRAWVESQATWNVWKTGSNWTGAGCSDTTDDREPGTIGTLSIAKGITYATELTCALDTTLVAEWVAGTFANNGVAAKTAEETNNLCFVASSDHATASYRPKLVVDYTLPAGLRVFSSAFASPFAPPFV